MSDENTPAVCPNCGKAMGATGAPHAHIATETNANGKTVFARIPQNDPRRCGLCGQRHGHVAGIDWLCLVYQAQQSRAAVSLPPLSPSDPLAWQQISIDLRAGRIKLAPKAKPGRKSTVAAPIAGTPAAPAPTYPNVLACVQCGNSPADVERNGQAYCLACVMVPYCSLSLSCTAPATTTDAEGTPACAHHASLAASPSALGVPTTCSVTLCRHPVQANGKCRWHQTTNPPQSVAANVPDFAVPNATEPPAPPTEPDEPAAPRKLTRAQMMDAAKAALKANAKAQATTY